MYAARPYIEEMLEANPNKDDFNYLCYRLQTHYYTEHFYVRIRRILKNNPRLALYLPFEVLEAAPNHFKETYRQAWAICLSHIDIRECFNLGDIYEPEARPCEPERIIKAAHLLPWLLDNRVIPEEDISEIFEYAKQSDLLFHSFADTARLLYDRGYISKTYERKITTYAARLPRIVRLEPLFTTEKRKEWLAEMCDGERVQLQNPSGPFAYNIPTPEIADAYKRVPDNHIAIIGGSRLKGYGRDKSDFDCYDYNIDTRQIVGFENADIERISHLILNTIWVGKDEQQVETVRNGEIARIRFANDEIKRRCLCRQERDLLQFRLMHKGFPKAYDDISFATRNYPEIDGGSAFYDERYRNVATRLFVKYMYLP